MNKYKQIKTMLDKANDIALFGHRNIDGDAVWSMIAIWNVLEQMNKKVSYFSSHKIPNSLEFLWKNKKFKNKLNYKKEYDCIVFLDFAQYKRILEFTEWHKEYFDKHTIIIIDHHEGETEKTAKITIQEEESNSNCEILRKIIKENWKKYINPEIATALYTWLITDTGNFTFGDNKATTQSLKIAAEIIESGADKEKIIKNIFYRQSELSIKFLEKLIKRIKKDDVVLYTYFKINELKKYKIDKDQAAILFGSVISKIYWPRIMAIFKIEKNETRWSLRQWNNPQNKKINCAKIAKELFDWWGHPWAAWFQLKKIKNTNKQIKNTVKKINEYLQK